MPGGGVGGAPGAGRAAPPPPGCPAPRARRAPFEGPPPAPDHFDAVAISSLTARIKNSCRLANAFRARGVNVILGCLHLTVLPDEAARHADAVVVGEAEAMWPKVVRDLEAGTRKARYQAPPRTFDLAHAPLPRFDLLDPAR